MTSWKGLSSFWKSSLTPQQLRMPSLNKVEFLSIGISVIALAIIGTAIHVLSFLILCKRQFRKFHLTPYFLNIALANVLVITVDLPAVAISAFAEKQLMGDIFCQVRLTDMHTQDRKNLQSNKRKTKQFKSWSTGNSLPVKLSNIMDFIHAEWCWNKGIRESLWIKLDASVSKNNVFRINYREGLDISIRYLSFGFFIATEKTMFILKEICCFSSTKKKFTWKTGIEILFV